MNINTHKNFTKAKRVIREHYGLDRAVTDAETEAEIASITRKRDKGSLDDMGEVLSAKLALLGF